MAYALAPRLLRAVKASGLSYKTVKGWESRGRGTMGSIESVMAHHTAGARTGNSPSLSVVTYGHGSLPGPLCHFHLARDGTVTLVAAGVANHAGVVSATIYTNPRSIGIEAENTGLSNDQPWPIAQMVAYALLCRALIDEFKLPVSRVVGHKEAARPKGRKIDPTFSMPSFRSSVANAKPGGTPTPTIEEGILGMTRYDSNVRSGHHQAVPAGSRMRMRVQMPTKDHSGPHKIATARAGKLAILHVKGDLTGMTAGQHVRVNLAVVKYPGGKIVERFPQIKVSRTSNGRDSFEVTQIDRCSHKGTGLEYVLEIENPNKQAVTLTWSQSRAVTEA